MALELSTAPKLRPSGHPVATLPQISAEVDHAGTVQAGRKGQQRFACLCEPHLSRFREGTRWGAPLAADSTLRKEFERNGWKRDLSPSTDSEVPGARPYRKLGEGESHFLKLIW